MSAHIGLLRIRDSWWGIQNLTADHQSVNIALASLTSSLGNRLWFENIDFSVYGQRKAIEDTLSSGACFKASLDGAEMEQGLSRQRSPLTLQLANRWGALRSWSLCKDKEKDLARRGDPLAGIVIEVSPVTPGQ